MNEHEVRLDMFEGPAELLLYLVRKAELDVFDVPIARLTDDFLSFVRAAADLNMEAASDFLVMAAVLLRLKMRQLLPRPREEALETVTLTLDQILDEFRRFQQAASLLHEKESERRQMYPRPGETPRSQLAESEDVMLLTAAFRRVLARMAPEQIAEIPPIRIRLQDRIASLRLLLGERTSVGFDEAVAGTTIAEVIVMFVAVLELVRLGEVSVRQDAEFGSIRLELRQPAPTAS